MNLKEREAVEFKGTGRGLVLYIDRESSMESIFDSISNKIKSSPNFFIGGVLTDIDSNYVSPYQKKLIIEYLDENYDITYTGVDEFHFNEQMKQKEYKGATAVFKAIRTMYIMDISQGELIDYNGSLVIMTTTPKNCVIKASCDITVLGSIEVDSTVISGGNIIVMGEVRGMVYAGAYGNDSACVIARQINSQKLAIFDCQSESAMSQRRSSMSNPEIAYINENKEITISQKKEILFKYAPESIKDTSYGAFDIKEQGIMMEKNQSFEDFSYEIKQHSKKDSLDYDSELNSADKSNLNRLEMENTEGNKTLNLLHSLRRNSFREIDANFNRKARKDDESEKNRPSKYEKNNSHNKLEELKFDIKNEKIDSNDNNTKDFSEGNKDKKTGKTFVDKIKDLLIEEEVNDEKNRL